MEWLKPLIRTARKTLTTHAPDILMGMGTVGVGTSVIFALKNGEKAVYLIEEAQRKKAEEERKAQGAADGGYLPFLAELDWKEKLKAVWKVYLPPVGIALFSIGCFWGAHGIDLKRQAVLAGLYSTAEATLSEYQKAMDNLIGKDGRKEVERSAAEEKVQKMSLPSTPSMLPGTDRWCCIDGHLFPSTYIKIKDVQNKANHRMFQEMYLSKLELYWMLDPNGDYLKDKDAGEVGWSIDRLLVLDIQEIDGPDHVPMYSIEYKDDNGYWYPPRPEYGQMK